jgi:AbrB family looped-hinge helix DNA binding protein
MAATKKPVTTLSSRGRISVPAAILRKRNWKPGTRLMVKDVPDGILLTAAPIFPPTRPEDVFGSLAYAGAPKTLEDMQMRVERRVKAKRSR